MLNEQDVIIETVLDHNLNNVLVGTGCNESRFRLGVDIELLSRNVTRVYVSVLTLADIYVAQGRATTQQCVNTSSGNSNTAFKDELFEAS